MKGKGKVTVLYISSNGVVEETQLVPLRVTCGSRQRMTCERTNCFPSSVDDALTKVKDLWNVSGAINFSMANKRSLAANTLHEHSKLTSAGTCAVREPLRASNQHKTSFSCPIISCNIDGYLLSYFVTTMKQSQAFRKRWFEHLFDATHPSNSVQSSITEPKFIVFVAVMKSPNYEVLDLLGNKMINSNILFRRSLEHALSWLSTLGGAFSALGDLNPKYAEEAGHISLTQLRIANKLGDPGIQSRCRLYAAISFLQEGYLKSCRNIVRNEYKKTMALPVETDLKLRKMCLGIWAKLQYNWRQAITVSDSVKFKSTYYGLKKIRNNAKYWNTYDLEENRKIAHKV